MTNEICTLSRRDYVSEVVFEVERARIFRAGWMLAGRSDRLAAGSRTTVDIAGEHVILTRDGDGQLHALANVCRHRGALLCDGGDDAQRGSISCPYHAWTYALDGQLIATPRIDAGELDKSAYPLHRYHVAEWKGFVFISVAATPPPFDDWLEQHGSDLIGLSRFGFGELVVGATRVSDVRANWKVIVENFQECLHCPRVHPQLIELIPAFRTGSVVDASRDDGGVTLARGNSFAFADVDLPVLPGISDVDATSYYGGIIFPNGLVEATGTCVILTTLTPRGPDLTTLTVDYLFAHATVAAPGFDPTPIVEFNGLLGEQDEVVCERVQRGVQSSSFAHGVLTTKDEHVMHFDERYLAARGAID